MTHCSMLISLVFVISINLSFAQHDLICRSCDKATTLSDCPHRIICDNTMEECFIDKVITNSLTVVFNAGCRAKSICKLASLVGRKRDMTACSRCCNSHDCNRGLCGLSHGTLTTKAPVITTKTTTTTTTTTPSPNSPIRCYTCGDGQGHSVTQPQQCVTQQYCQTNEMCYVTENVVGGHSSFTYGCRSKLMCRYGMKLQYDHYKLCVLNVTQPDYGLSWNAVCGSAKKRSTETCNSCCGDSGCNHGSCKYQNTHLFTLAYYGRVDMTTLKVIH